MKPRRIAIIGNSFIGVVVKALEREPQLAGGLMVDFAGSVGGNLGEMTVQDGRLIGARTAPHFALADLRCYDALYLYGLLPSVHAIADRLVRLRQEGYSRQIIDLAIADLIGESDVVRLRPRLAAAVDAPIFLLSGNTRSDSPALAEESYATALAILSERLDDCYMPTPRSLLSAMLQPLIEYYRGSLTIDGVPPKNQAKHDINHLNMDGGAIMLAAIIDHARMLAMPSALVSAC